MEDYKLRYEKLKEEYENYQSFVEMHIQKLSNRNMKLEKDINALANIVEISKYINSFLSNDNLLSMINDMIIGLIGVANSTILLEENGELIVKSTNTGNKMLEFTEEEMFYIKNWKSYLINSKEGLRSYNNSSLKISSVMGMPISIRNKYIGFVVIEHYHYGYLDENHEKFLRAISNQISIGIENSVLYKELEDFAKYDPLLGIYNRRYFFEEISQIITNDPEKPYAIVMVDLDNFKSINDRYGHQFGDVVLMRVTEIIKNMVDSEDIVARYGGEEIIIYINNVETVRDVYDKIEAIRMCIEKSMIVMDNISKSVTASFGIGYYPKDAKSLHEVIKVADRFLYRSKALGKNMVLITDLLL